MKSERIELNTDRRNWIPDYLSDQWFGLHASLECASCMLPWHALSARARYRRTQKGRRIAPAALGLVRGFGCGVLTASSRR